MLFVCFSSGPATDDKHFLVVYWKVVSTINLLGPGRTDKILESIWQCSNREKWKWFRTRTTISNKAISNKTKRHLFAILAASDCGYILGARCLLVLLLALPTSRITNRLAVLIVQPCKKMIKVAKITFWDIWHNPQFILSDWSPIIWNDSKWDK